MIAGALASFGVDTLSFTNIGLFFDAVSNRLVIRDNLALADREGGTILSQRVVKASISVGNSHHHEVS